MVCGSESRGQHATRRVTPFVDPSTVYRLQRAPMATKIKRTYSSRSRLSLPSSQSSSPTTITKRKPLGEGIENEPPTKRRMTTKTLPSRRSEKPKQRVLRQLHFSLETSVLRTCSICGLSYTQGTPDDESLHRAHCSRVQRGMEWGREEEREVEKAGVEEVQSGLKLKDGKKGRIICFKANVSGRIGSKVSSDDYIAFVTDSYSRVQSLRYYSKP